ncbi:MAG: lytic transglycosylase domain-containing protein [Myxococcales bacterium]|nr:lytic transglycosylase domain-containing protein [Myxococcales bacterium]
MKGLYDRITGAFLKLALIVALTAWVLDALFGGTATLLGLQEALTPQIEGMEQPLSSRFLFFAVVELVVVAALWGPLNRLTETAERYDAPEREISVVGLLLLPVRWVLGLVYSLIATALLLFLVLQPTLVPLRIDGHSWVRRVQNLVDGTTTLHLVDIVLGAGWGVVAEPIAPIETVEPDTYFADLDAESIPLIDRWDTQLLEAADGDRELAAQTKAFMWVESGGRQYAVSATGCAGLMQFCASTAERRPFRSVFGAGQVAPCGCRDCGIPVSVQVAMETDPEAAQTYDAIFPCNLADARFIPERSIKAGVLYLQELSDKVGGSLPLMYVGYNSGPLVAVAVHKALGKPEGATIEDIRPHLATAMKPYYGSKSEGRARGLLNVHLPKLEAAYQRFR